MGKCTEILVVFFKMGYLPDVEFFRSSLSEKVLSLKSNHGPSQKQYGPITIQLSVILLSAMR